MTARLQDVDCGMMPPSEAGSTARQRIGHVHRDAKRPWRTPQAMSKVLIVSPCSTHPPTEGNRQRVLSLAQALTADGHEVHLAFLPNNKFDSDDSATMANYWEGRLHVLYPFHRWTAGFRLRRALAPLISAVLRPLVRAAETPPRITSVDEIYYDWWDVQLMRLQLQHRFDVVFAEYIFVSRALFAFPATVRKIIDTHDIFSGRDEALNNERNIPSRWLSTDPASEGLALARADVALGIQDEESAHLRELTQVPVATVGHFIKPVASSYDAACGHGPRILFVGSANPINVDGCVWFIDQVLGKVRDALPDATLRVVGGAGDKLATRYNDDPRLDIVGRVDDLTGEYASALVVINPVQFGTGLAIKSIEALAHGCALICTPAGARGVRLTGEEHAPCAVADSPEAFAATLVGLLTDESARDALRETARHFVAAWNQHQADNLRSVVQR